MIDEHYYKYYSRKQITFTTKEDRDKWIEDAKLLDQNYSLQDRVSYRLEEFPWIPRYRVTRTYLKEEGDQKNYGEGEEQSKVHPEENQSRDFQNEGGSGDVEQRREEQA